MPPAADARKRLRARLVLGAGLVVPLVVAVLFLGPSPSAPPGRSPAFGIVGGIVLGIFFAVLAAVVYGLATLTHCFTFDFRAAVWRTFRWRFVVTHFVFQLFFVFATTSFMIAVVAAVFALLGRQDQTAVIGLVLGAVISFPLLQAVNVWVPLERSLTSRVLASRGVTADEIARGIPVGLSDPAFSSWKKGVIEDDVGVLWLARSALIYRGDSESFYIPREQVVAIERDVDPSSSATALGAAHPVVVWTTDGTVRRRRIHAAHLWLNLAMAAWLDDMAHRLETWRGGDASEGRTA